MVRLPKISFFLCFWILNTTAQYQELNTFGKFCGESGFVRVRVGALGSNYTETIAGYKHKISRKIFQAQNMIMELIIYSLLLSPLFHLLGLEAYLTSTNSGFVLDEKFQRNASKFVMLFIEFCRLEKLWTIYIHDYICNYSKIYFSNGLGKKFMTHNRFIILIILYNNKKTVSREVQSFTQQLNWPWMAVVVDFFKEKNRISFLNQNFFLIWLFKSDETDKVLWPLRKNHSW